MAGLDSEKILKKTDGARGKLLLIDGNSVLYRAFYGVPLLSTASGLYTNAVYGLAMMLLKLLADERPTHVAVAFDKGKITFRHSEFPEYKGKRQATPEELSGQFQMARDLLGYFRIPALELETYEADDIIGTLATAARSDDFDVFVVSGDKDLLQLVSDHITAGMTRKGTTDIVRYDPAAVFERYSLTPKQIIDLKGLMGDSSDNIPGVPGVGEKTAIKLLGAYGSVETVLDHITEISGNKLQERLRDNRELALLSKRLATINCQVPLQLGPADLRYEGYVVDEVKAAFRQYEFRSLLARIPAWNGAGAGQGVDAARDADSGGNAITARDANQAEDATTARDADSGAGADGFANDQVVSWEEFGRRVQGVTDVFAVLVDLQGSYQTGTWRGLAIAHRDDAFYVPLSDELLLDAETRNALGAFLKNDAVKVVFDSKALMVRGVLAGLAQTPEQVCPHLFDTLLVSYLIHTSEGEPDLLAVLEKALPEEEVPEALREALEAAGAGAATAWAHIECARRLLRAYGALRKTLDDYELNPLYEQVEAPLAIVLAELELYGVRLDVSRLETIGGELATGIERLTAQIYELAGHPFNINSTKQLGEILFDQMGLPPVKKTKTGYSTSADVLEKLAPHSEIVSLILEYRQLAKLQSTYVEGLLRVVREPQSRVHTSFHQAMTATGRLSSADPNLQNIPVRMEEGRRLRQAFVPTDPEWLIVSADYSQVELRILAHLSQDGALIDAFQHDIDVHTRTASDVFEVPLERVTSLMRRQAKAVNFGIVYGISDYGLSQNLNISRAQAADFITQYFAKFPGVKQYMEQSVEQARERGYAETVLGRRRYLPQIRSRNFNERSFAERTAMNTPIQGTAADIIKIAMVKLGALLRTTELKARMLLQVHDELLFECPVEELSILSDHVRNAMEGAVELSVPLKVDLHAGPTWYDAK
ncbi:MAG: DNA polymerase I [Bacilli bacterium]